MFHNPIIPAVCCVLFMWAAAAAAQHQWTVPAAGGAETVKVILQREGVGRGSKSVIHAAAVYSATEDVMEDHEPTVDWQSEERQSQMKRSTPLLETNRSRSGSYEPQPGDVPVTVVTALILLLVLCVVALL